MPKDHSTFLKDKKDVSSDEDYRGYNIKYDTTGYSIYLGDKFLSHKTYYSARYLARVDIDQIHAARIKRDIKHIQSVDAEVWRFKK